MKKKRGKVRKELHHLRILAGHLFRFRYPKLAFLVASIVISYFVFSNPAVSEKISGLHDFGYLGVFVAGMFYSFGFSAPFVVGFLLKVEGLNVFAASIIGGVGSLLTDLFIFSVIKFSFIDEFYELEKTKPFRFINKLMKKDLSPRLRRVLFIILSAGVIASPLPDEIGITILSGLTKITMRTLAILSFVLSTLGIFILLSL